MSRFLLDVNFLIALVDPDHVHHDPAHAWFGTLADAEWLTCPITQNGAIRVVTGPKYVNGPVRLPDAVESLRTVIAQGSHVFVPDEISLLDDVHIDATRLTSAAQITDTYLLALATSQVATFVTFEKRMITSAVVSPKVSILTLI
jgi:toxin-antitoxin system PIN domain toxin